MRTLLCVVLTAAILAVASAACPSEDWKPLFDKCYWASPPGTTLLWKDVSAACEALFPGARMVSIHELTVHAFLTERMLNFEGGWIGYDCRNGGGGYWEDGTPLDFRAWANHEDFHYSCSAIHEGDFDGGLNLPGCWSCSSYDCETTHMRFLCETDQL